MDTIINVNEAQQKGTMTNPQDGMKIARMTISTTASLNPKQKMQGLTHFNQLGLRASYQLNQPHVESTNIIVTFNNEIIAIRQHKKLIVIIIKSFVS